MMRPSSRESSSRQAAIEAAAEAEMARRYHASLVSHDGGRSGTLRPGTAPAGAASAAVASSALPVVSLNDRHPATRPNSGIELGFDRDALKEALMKGHRGAGGVNSSSFLSRPGSALSTASGMSSFVSGATPADTSSLFAAKLRNHRVQPELHLRPDAGASFFQSGQFRSLYNQLQNATGGKSIAEAAWDRVALETLDQSMTQKGGMKELEELHRQVDAKFASLTGDSDDGSEKILYSAKARLQFFVRQMEEKLAPFPGLSNLQRTLSVEYGKYIHSLESQHDVSVASISRQALEESVVTAADAKRELLLEKKRTAELKLLVEKLTAANKEHEASGKELQKYIFELRLVLSTSSNGSLKSASALLPDNDSSKPSAFIDATRRLVGEVDVLRRDNMRLAESSAMQLVQLETQNQEMYEVLARGNAFQQQVGQLKATVRVMKEYMERLEARIRELRNVHEENEKMRLNVGERMAVLRKELALPYEYGASCTQHAVLQLRGIGYVCPSEYADGPTAPEGGSMPLGQLVLTRLPRRQVCAPHQAEDEIPISTDDGGDDMAETVFTDGQNSAASETFTARPPPQVTGTTPDTGVPLHLHSKYSKIKLKMMTAAEVRIACNDALQDFNNSNTSWQSKDAFRLLVPFDVYAKDWFAKRHRSERAGAELAMSVFYWSYTYRHKCVEAMMFYRVSCGLVCGTVFIQAPLVLQNIKKAVVAVEAPARKGKDKITREAFVAAVMSLFPLAGPTYAEALTATTVLAQEAKFAEDVSADPYFEKATTGPNALVYDELIRLVLTHVELFHLTLEEKLYSEMKKATEARFDALRRARDENGVTGKVGLNPLLIDSAIADQSGKVDMATFARALKQVDPHCRKRTFLDRLAAAARAPEYVRSVQNKDKAAQDAFMAQQLDVTAVLKNFRTGVFPTIAAPLAAGEADEPFPQQHP